MSITACEARRQFFPLIKKVNEDHDAIEIVSRHGNAFLVSAEDYAALREGAYLLRSPANARRLRPVKLVFEDRAGKTARPGAGLTARCSCGSTS